MSIPTMKTEPVVRRTRSVCPVCLAPIPAALVQTGAEIWMEKRCLEHGFFRVPVWRGKLDYGTWVSGAKELAPDEGLSCPGACGLCAEHQRATCCSLLEVTNRCNLRCSFCFAHGAERDAQPSLESLKSAVADLMERCGKPLLQLSGGEPTMRDDLPELTRYARSLGFEHIQLNTNGIRLAREPDYARALRDAGVSIIFLQFDALDNAVYIALRARPLLELKKRAIAVCDALKMGVTLVPTVVRGVNDDQLGALIRFAAENVPAVRGVHLQPVSYFGRIPKRPDPAARITLDELIWMLCEQTGLPADCFLPSRCDHPMCGFHAQLLVEPQGGICPLLREASSGCDTTAAQNRAYVARRWERRDEAESTSEGGFEDFIRMMRQRSLTLTAMAFQDAENLDIERLRRCSLHVYHDGKVRPFCANYLTAMPES